MSSSETQITTQTLSFPLNKEIGMGYDFIIIKDGIEYKCLVTLMHDINMAKKSAFIPLIWDSITYDKPTPPLSPIPYLKSPIDNTIFYDTTGSFIILDQYLFTVPHENKNRTTKHIADEFDQADQDYCDHKNERFKNISMIVTSLAFVGFDITVENDKFTITNNYPLPILNSIRNLYFQNQNLHIKEEHITLKKLFGVMTDIHNIEKNSYPCKCSDITQNKNSKLYILSECHDIPTPCMDLKTFALNTPMHIIESYSERKDFYFKVHYPIVIEFAKIHLKHTLANSLKHEDKTENAYMRILPEALVGINISPILLAYLDQKYASKDDNYYSAIDCTDNSYSAIDCSDNSYRGIDCSDIDYKNNSSVLTKNGYFTDIKTQLPTNLLNSKSLEISNPSSSHMKKSVATELKNYNYIGSHIVGGEGCASILHICSKHRLHWLEIIDEDICTQI